MKKIALVAIVLLWILCLIILIIALTDLVSNNIFKEYRLAIGIGFIAVTGFFRAIYRRLLE